MSGPQTYQGSCHCGRVRFELEGRVGQAFECNCSICRRKGALWHSAQPRELRIVAGAEELASYRFNTGTAEHFFCRHCGIHPFSHPRIDPRLWVVNLRCVDSVDLETLTVTRFDGANWEAAARALLQRLGRERPAL